MNREAIGGRRITLDHIVPRSQGGADEEENFVGACRTCNAAKADMSAEAFRAARGAFAGRGFPVVEPARRWRR
jgi:hypothetical protein